MKKLRIKPALLFQRPKLISQTDRFTTSARIHLSFSIGLSAILVIGLCTTFDLYWETNDDAAMSMVAHGYGLAAVGSPKLVFSNVIWGKLVQLMPQVGDLLGYSLMMLIVLTICGAVFVYGLLRQKNGYLMATGLLALFLVRPTLFPQFTINAGFLMVASLVCFHLYDQHRNHTALIFACLLAVFAYLVRSEEALAVLVISTPLWLCNLKKPTIKSAVFFLGLLSIFAVMAWVDMRAYATEDWDQFNALNGVRSAFTDFGAVTYFAQRPDILQAYGFSSNDLQLLLNWFFVDAAVADPDTLKAMLNDLGPLPDIGIALERGWEAFAALWHPRLRVLFIVSLLLACLRPSWKLVGAWGLFLVAIFCLGVLGRPAVFRVYVPILCLLIIAPLFVGRSSVWRQNLASGIVIVAAAITTSTAVSDAQAFQKIEHEIRLGLVGFPTEPVVIWGAGFPFQMVYPVLGTPQVSQEYELYGLGTLTFAPYMVSRVEQDAGRGMIDLFLKEDGVPIIAHAENFRTLGIYCAQRHNGNLETVKHKAFGTIEVFWKRCIVDR